MEGIDEIIFRHENCGLLIYSKPYKAYFVAKNEQVESEVLKLLKNEQIQTNEELLEELKNMGYGGKQRELFSNNDNNLMAPLEYYFDFTNKCNLQCTHCYNRENMNSHTMDKEQIKDIIKDMYENGTMRLHLAGGEPTLFPQELEVYAQTAKNYGIVTSMASNGTAITDEICDIITKNDLLSITISLESAFKEKNEQIRGKGSFDKAIDGIKKLVSYKEKNNSNILIGIKVSYDTNMEKEDFEELIKLAIKLKINVLKFANPERCIYHDTGYYSNIQEKYYKNIEIVRDLKEKYKNEIFITQISSPANQCKNIGLPNMQGCIGAQELVAINAKGDITPCLMNPYDLGNVKEYKSMQEVYKDIKMNEYLKQIKSHNCQKCELYPQCRGGCQVRKIVEYGEIKGKDPLCPKKNRIKIIENKEKVQEPLTLFKKVNVLHSL